MKNLQIKIHALNELTRIVNLEIDNVLKQLPSLIGKKVITTQDKPTANVAKIEFLKPIPVPFDKGFASNNLTYLNIDNYNMWLKVKLCFNGGSYDDGTYYCTYVDESIYLGGVKNSILIGIKDTNNLAKIEPINLTSELELINELKELEIKMQHIKAKIKLPFEDYKYL